MSNSITNDKEKKTYQPPEIKVIELAAEEVLAVGCKTEETSGEDGGPPTCTLGTCFTSGS
jgi:hypothetical protein